MLDEKISKEYRFKNIGKARHYWRNKTKWPNEKKCKKRYVFLNCIEHLLIKLALITGCASILHLFC